MFHSFQRDGGKKMAEKTREPTLQDLLLERSVTEESTKLESDLKGLFDTLSGLKLAESVIARVHRYVEAQEELTPDGDEIAYGLTKYTREAIEEEIRSVLGRYVSSFLTEAHRERIVRCHARGLSTSEAVYELMREDSALNRLAWEDAMGMKALRAQLVPRLAYLKPGSVRWPEKKYGSVWREEREQYTRELSHIPLTSQGEQAALLAKHVERIETALSGSLPVKDFLALTNSLVKTLESLNKLSAAEPRVPVELSGSQLVGVLERLTLALQTPGQEVLSGDKEALVGVLERLTFALKAPEQQAEGSSASALPAPGDDAGGASE